MPGEVKHEMLEVRRYVQHAVAFADFLT